LRLRELREGFVLAERGASPPVEKERKGTEKTIPSTIAEGEEMAKTCLKKAKNSY